MTTEEMQDRIETALDCAHDGSFDGAHHKMWVIDQMVRALTGCQHTGQGVIEETNDEYRAWVAAHEDGDEGPHTYEWDTGIAP